MIDLVLTYRYYQQGKKSQNLALDSFLNVHSRNSLHIYHHNSLWVLLMQCSTCSVSNSVKWFKDYAYCLAAVTSKSLQSANSNTTEAEGSGEE